MVPTAIPIITTHFKSIDGVGWYASAYFLGATAVHGISWKLYSIASVKLIYILNLVAYIAGSAVCGTSSSSSALMIGRAVSGAAAVCLSPGVLRMVAVSTPFKKRPVYSGLFGAMYGLASIVGPILGGSLTYKVSWRWIFYIKIPSGLVVLTIIIFLFNTSKGARDSIANMGWRWRMARLDIEGSVFITASLSCLILALNWGGTTMAWSDPRIIGLTCVFGILFVLFAAKQFWRKEDASLPPRLMKQRSSLGALWFSFTLGSSLQIVNYYLPFWFQTVKGVSALQSGIMNFPLVISLVVSSILSGVMVSAIGYYTPFMVGSSILTAVGTGMLSTLSPQSSHVAWILYQVLCGIGLGLGAHQPIMVAQNILEIRDAAAGVSMMILAQNLSAAIFASVSQNVFKGRLVSNLEQYTPSLDPATVLSFGAANLQDSIEPQYLGGVRLAYNNALSKSYLVAAVVAATSMVGSVVIEWKSIR
ncbi:major facilitator superfamily transporter, partial [Mollisia scopiformis]